MTSAPPDWAAIKAVFEQALDQPAAHRAAFVAEATLSESARIEVHSLLSHHAAATDQLGFLDSPGAAPQAAPAAQVGERFGAWQITAPIGSGGMGEVFEARRADGAYEGRAAIKLLRHGAGGSSADVLQRFAQERQALARLNHPHIATLFDAGLSPQGAPYFVMEHVQGTPIDNAAASRTLEARVELFLQLADAVAHAHRKLLVHRDLKPGNVLVTAEGQVKLLDFGVAKALDPLAGAHPDTTLGSTRPYTPNYASPEQVRGEAVGTSTDIYSLGVLLHQMLTGVRPTGRGATTPAEAVRSVLEEQPTRPSGLGADVVADPQWPATRKRLAGDLDNIVLKALEKTVERRYESVDALARDLRAWRGGHPVSAHAPDALYLATKFVRRHKLPVAAAAVAVLALVGGLGAASWQAQQARIARDEAQARLADIRGITRNLVFRFGDAVSYLPGGMKVKEDLLQDVLRNLDRLAQSTDRDPDLLADVANTYARLAELQGNDQSLSLGKPDAARINADKAIALATGLLPTRRADWRLASWAANAYLVRSKVFRGENKPAEGLKELEAAAAVLAAVDLTKADDLGRATIMGQHGAVVITEAQLLDQLAIQKLATAEQSLRKFDEAEAVYRPLAAQRAMLERIDLTGRPEEPKSYAQVLTNLGVVVGGRSRIRLRLEQLDQAATEAEAALALMQEAVAYDPPTSLWKDGLATAANHLSATRLRRGEYALALPAAQLATATGTALAREDGPQSKWALQLHQLGSPLGRALAGTGAHAQALVVFDDTIAGFTRARALPTANDAARANASRVIAWMQVQRARSLAALGRAEAGLQQAREASDVLLQMSSAAGASRDLQLNSGEALALLAQLDTPARARHLRAALDKYLAADAMQALAGVNAEALRSLRQAAGALALER